MRISVELVPKSPEQVLADAFVVRAASSAFTALNIPDLTRFALRSWERFPREFKPTMAWNKNFAARAISAVRELGGNAYLMPLRVNLKDYLDGIV